MSSYAELDKDNKVIRVLVGNPELDDEAGLQFMIDTFGGTWLQTSYNATIRGNFAGIGFSYLPDFDLFMPPKCHSEAILDTETAKWECVNEEHNVTH